MFVGNPFQYKYFLLLICLIHMMIVGAVCWSTGIYYVSWMKEFKCGSGITAWIGAAHIGSLCVVAPLSSYLVERVGYRKTCLLGAAISSVGIIGSAYAPDVYTLFALYGLLCGVGFGITLVPTSTAVAFYFKKGGRVMAVGLVTSGSGIGAFLMPYVINASLAEYGWRGSVLLAAGFVLNLFVTGALVRSPPQWKHGKDAVSCETETMCSPSFQNAGFILLLVHHSVVAAGVSVVYIHISAMTEYLTGASRDDSNLTLSVIGLANLFGRVLTSIIAQCRGVDTMTTFYCFTALMGITASILPLLNSYPLVIVWSICFGFFSSPNTSLSQIVVLNFVDISEVNAGLAYVFLLQAAGYVSGAPIAGALYDATGDYGWSFYLGGACILLGVVVFTWPLFVHLRGRRRDGTVTTKEEMIKKTQSLTFGSLMLISSHIIIPEEDSDSEPMVNGFKKITPVDV